MKTTPYTLFNDGKIARFVLNANSPLVLGDGGFNFLLFLSVQDCSLTTGFDQIGTTKCSNIISSSVEVREKTIFSSIFYKKLFAKTDDVRMVQEVCLFTARTQT